MSSCALPAQLDDLTLRQSRWGRKAGDRVQPQAFACSKYVLLLRSPVILSLFVPRGQHYCKRVLFKLILHTKTCNFIGVMTEPECDITRL